MAQLYGSGISAGGRVSGDKDVTGSVRFYVNYSVTTNPTNVVISGNIYAQYTNRGYNPRNSFDATGIGLQIGSTTVVSGKTKSLNVVNTYNDWTTTASIASFSHTVNRAKQTTNTSVTLRVYGNVSLTVSCASVSSAVWYNSGSLSDTVTITIPHVERYSITYKANGGTGSDVTDYKYYGDSYTIRINPFSRSSSSALYSFRYWNTATNGSGTTYNSSATYSGNANLTLYAIWHAPAYASKISSSGGGTYYQNASAKQYSVTFAGLITYDSASVTMARLTIGNQITTISNPSSGTLSITPNTIGTFTPRLAITDSLGATSYTDFTQISVVANSEPAGTASIISSGYYYNYVQGATNTPVTIRISNAAGTNGKSISSIVLNVGGATASRTGNGDLSVVPTTTGNSVSVKVTVTDNLGVSHIALNTSVAVLSNDKPTVTYVVRTTAPYYVNASTRPYKLELTGLSGKNYKSVTSVKLTLGSKSQTLTALGTFSIVPAATGSITPTLLITDSKNVTNTVNLSSIPVTANEPPTISTIATQLPTTGYYYAGVTKYTVVYTGASAKNGKTIASIVLKLGSQTATSTAANGTLEILPNTAATFSGTTKPTVVITDNIGNSTTYNVTPDTVTILENTEPTATVVGPSSTDTTFYAGAPQSGTASKPYTVTISNLQAYNHKSIISTTLTIGSQSMSITGDTGGSITIYPSTSSGSGTFTPAVVVKDSQNKTKTYNLTPIKVLPIDTLVSSSTIQRISATSGNTVDFNDEGYNALLTIKLNYTKYTGNYLLEPVIKADGAQIGSSYITWYTGFSNNTLSGQIASWPDEYQPNSPITLYAKITYTFAIDRTYAIGIVPKTTAKTGVEIKTNLAQAFYLLAGKAGGHALGIGKKPSANNLLDIGIPAKIDGSLDVAEVNSYSRIYQSINSDVTEADVKVIDPSLTTSSTDSDWLKALVAALCVKYNNKQNYVFRGKLSPNSSGYYEVFIYNTSTIDTNTKLPQYCAGTYRKWSNVYCKFWTNSYAWSYTDLGSIEPLSGTLAIAHGGTGKTTAKEAGNVLIDALDTASADWQDATLILTSDAAGDTNLYYRRPATNAWNYIASKINNGSYTNKNFIAKHTTIDLTADNNGVTAQTAQYFGLRDKNNDLFGVYQLQAQSNGNVEAYIGLRNRKLDDTWTGWKGINVSLNKQDALSILLNGSLIIQKGTVGTNTFADANPKLIFRNSDASQNGSLTWTDYDSVQSPASLTLNGNQGGEYFIAPNIKATTNLYGNLMGRVTKFSSRQANANITQDGIAGVTHFLATGTMTSNKPDDGDGHILHMTWDNTGGYDSQLYVQNGNSPKMRVRGQSGGTWGSWYKVYTEIDSYKRSSAGTLDWSSQADGDVKVIMKSALAFWNGAYSGTNSNLAYCNKGAFGTLATKNSLSASDVGALPTRPGSIEFQPASSSSGNGGFIDFHFNQSSSDYTSRIIENASGNLSVSGSMTIGSSLTAGTSLTASNGLIYTTCNGKKTTIGSQNASYCHVYTDAAEFAFNKTIAMISGSVGNTTYPASHVYIKNDGHLYGKETGGTARGLIWMSTTNTVNVGNGSNPTYVNGTSFSGSKSYTGSDLRLKHNIIPLDERSFELLMKLKPFEYEWNEGEEHYYSEGKCFGLGAQEVSEALEEVGYSPSDYKLVEEDPDGYYAVSYIELIPHLIYALQKQQRKIEALKAEVKIIKEAN